MVNTIKEIFTYFFTNLYIFDKLTVYSKYLPVIFITLGVLLAFLGLKIYKVLFSLIIFMTCALLFNFLLKGFVVWPSIVTAFVIVGSGLGFLGLKFNKLGVVVVSGLLAYLLFDGVFNTFIVSIIITLITLITAYYFPLITVIFITSLSGSVLIYESLNLNYLLLGVIFTSSIIFQAIISRGQKDFVKKPKNRKNILLKKWRGTIMHDVLRKEIKYIIPIEHFSRLKVKLDLLMERDENGVNGKYLVRSQYYDSVRDNDVFDNLSGVEEKRKIRVRIYSPKSLDAKLEYKMKSNTDSRKMSIALTKDQALRMEAGNFSFLLDKDEDLAKLLFVKINQNGYRPKSIVEYQRLAFKYPVSDLRITFDTEVRSTVDPYGLFKDHLASIPLLSEDLGILEIKYSGFLPSPFSKIVSEIDKIAEGVSKYSLSRLLG